MTIAAATSLVAGAFASCNVVYADEYDVSSNIVYKLLSSHSVQLDLTVSWWPHSSGKMATMCLVVATMTLMTIAAVVLAKRRVARTLRLTDVIATIINRLLATPTTVTVIITRVASFHGTSKTKTWFQASSTSHLLA